MDSGDTIHEVICKGFFSDAYTDDEFERIGIDAVDNSSDHDYGIIICRT